jgi:hypothetical protein
MAVVERADEADVRREQHAVAEHVPDMSPIPTTVKSLLCVSVPSSRKWRLTDSQRCAR